MNRDVVLGIDLGTTNSVVAVADGGQARVLSNEMGERLIPSVVSFKPDGGIVIGDEARERRLLDAKHTVYSVKRLIGRPYRTPEVRRAQERFAFDIVESPSGGVVVAIRGESYTLTEVSSLVLREIARVAEATLGFKVERAVITVPANFNELQRSATKAAGRVAGLDVLRIINEPTAAALAYGYGKTKPERVAVYDLGGGTFDLTILELENDVFEVVSTAGDSFLGGDDLDLVVAEMMCDAFLEQHRWDPRSDRQAFERLRAAGEWAKCQLSDEPLVELTIEELHYGAGGKPLDLQFRLGREELEKRMYPFIARSFDVCQSAFSDAKLKPSEIDSVVLVGGSTRVPMVRAMVEEYFGKTPRNEIDPDLVVAQGAAIHGYAVGGQARQNRPSLARVSLKRISAADLAKLKASREARREALPNQPAFAPTEQVEEARPAAKNPPRPTHPPPTLPDLPQPRLSPMAAFDQTPTRIAQAPKPPPPPPLGEALDLPGIDLEDIPTAVSWRPSSIPGVIQAAPPIPVGIPATKLDDELASYLEDSNSLPPAPPAHRPAPPPPPPAPPRTPSVPPMPVVDLVERAPPLLMDVTPHSLGLETAGGYCQHLIRRNAPIPAEHSRVFSTAADLQDSVMVRVCQGEERGFANNQLLGEVTLTGLRAAPRGELQIEVAFLLDASGTLDVRAVDVDTGKEQIIRINLLGGASDADIAAMQERQERLLA